MTQIDKSYEIFQSKKVELLTYSSSDISESDTRSKIIDVFFKDILGWEESDIERERFVQVGYYDYHNYPKVLKKEKPENVIILKKYLHDFKYGIVQALQKYQ